MKTNMFNEKLERRCAYRSDVHNFVKVLQKAEIMFPCSKDDIVAKIKGIEVQVDFNEFIPATSFIESVEMQEFVNAFIFYNAMFSELIPNSLQYE